MAFFARLATLFIDIQTRGQNVANTDIRKLAASFYLVEQGARLVIGATTEILQRAGEIELKFIKIGNAAEFSADQTKQFSKNLLESAARLKAVGIDDLQEIALAASQAGVKGGPAIQSFTEAVARAAAVSEQISAGELAKFLLLMQDLFGRGTEATEQYANALHVLAQEFRTNEFEIVKVAEKIAGAGKIFGLTEAQILALSAALRTVAVTSERSSSFVSRFLRDLQINPELFESVLGLKPGLRDRANTQPFEALKEVLAALSKQGTNTATVLKELGFSDVRVFTTVQQLTEGYHKLIAAEKASDEAILNGKKVREDFNKIQEGMAAQVNALTIAWDRLKISLAEKGPFGGIIKEITDLANAVRQLNDEGLIAALLDPLGIGREILKYRRDYIKSKEPTNWYDPVFKTPLSQKAKNVVPQGVDLDALDKFDEMLKSLASRGTPNTSQEKIAEIEAEFREQEKELAGLNLPREQDVPRWNKLLASAQRRIADVKFDTLQDDVRAKAQADEQRLDRQHSASRQFADLLATPMQQRQLALIEQFSDMKRGLSKQDLARNGPLLDKLFQSQFAGLRSKQAEITDTAEAWKKNQLEILNKEKDIPKKQLEELMDIGKIEAENLPAIRKAVEKGMVGRAGP